jgi:putative endonuclease
MPFFCYILQCSDGSYYTGWTTDPERRLKQHNKGTGARYTRAHRPVRLVYVEELPDLSSAMKREHRIKRFPRRKEQLVARLDGNDKAD